MSLAPRSAVAETERALLSRSLSSCALVAFVTVVLSASVGVTRADALEQLCDSSFQNCRTQLLSLIQNENVEIDVGLWFMEDARYSSAIISRFQAGVQVRILMDPRVFPQDAQDKTLMDQLQGAGIPMRKRIASGIEHWKAMVFAGQNTVYFGSANFSADAFVPVTPYVNYVDETVYYTDDASVVNSFKTKFDNAWIDTTNYANYANVVGALVRHYPVSSIDPELNFVPDQSYATRSVSAYNAETQKIDVSMFRITDQRHTNAIISAFVNRHVPVRLVVDPGQYRAPTRLWDAWNVDRMWAAGIPVRITTHQGEDHMKLVLLYGQGMTIFGSSNWSSPSGDTQHEHNYFTKKSNIFTWFVDQFDRKWNNTNPSGAQETGPFTPLPPDKPVYQSPANGAVGVPTTNQKLVWDGGPWAHVYDIYFGTTPTPPLFLANQNLGPDDPTKSPKQFQSVVLPTLQPGVTYYWQIVSKTMANVSKAGSVWSFTTAGTAAPLPSPWSDADIGAVPIAGSATYSNGTFTITGSGADIWGSADAFNFVYQPMSGDGSIQMRVDTVQNTNAWSKAGVMIRESLAANAAHGLVLVSAAKGVAFQRRDATGSTSVSTSGSASAPPHWVRLVRSGNTLTAQESADGASWTTIGTDTIAMGASVFVGVAVTSHSTSASATATVDNVTVSADTTGGGTGGLPSPWAESDVGAVSAAGSTSYAGGTFTIKASGADIWGTADAFHFVYQQASGDAWVVARVDSIQNANAWSKGGVMIRETLDAGAKHAVMLASAAKGMAFQRRDTTGGTSVSTPGSTSSPPRWVALSRAGDTITAFESADGSTWIQVGSDTIPMASTVYIGLAVTSHTTAASTTAAIEQVTVSP